MYTLFTHLEYGLPTVVSQNSKDYPTFVMSGNYKEEYTGHKKDCQELEREILETLLVND